MYKFYVQTSLAANMVVVDQKMQEAVPSTQLLFYSGTMMQAVVHETDARWSDPPYGGMQYVPGQTFSQRMAMNKMSVPLVADRRYGELGPYSDRVLQRRLGIVTDDYIVIADYLKAAQPHTFDNLFQLRGFLGFDPRNVALLRHDAQFNPDPHSAGQFVTDCDWYQAAAPAVAMFQTQSATDSEEAAAMRNQPGPLKIDVHSLWPAHQQIMLGTAPQAQGSAQWVSYEVDADGRALAKGESGIWILGAVNIDVPVKDARELTLIVKTNGRANKKALFLANARFVSGDGREIPLVDAPAGENIDPLPKPGGDYYGGPVKIAGAPYDKAIPMQPADTAEPAILRIPIGDKGALRFKATLGGDYPFGAEDRLRKVYAIRSQGTEARFLTVLEPYENEPAIKSATAINPDSLRIQLADGRVQVISIRNFTGPGAHISIAMTEMKDGRQLREEVAATEPR